MTLTSCSGCHRELTSGIFVNEIEQSQKVGSEGFAAWDLGRLSIEWMYVYGWVK